MKKLLLLIVAVVAVSVICYGAAVAIDNHYQNHQKQKQAQSVVYVPKTYSDQQIQNVKTAAAGEYQSLVAQYNNQTAECQKGTGAYALLTPAQKAKVPAPTCLPAQQ